MIAPRDKQVQGRVMMGLSEAPVAQEGEVRNVMDKWTLGQGRIL